MARDDCWYRSTAAGVEWPSRAIDRWASQLDLFDDDATDRSRVVGAVTYADASGPVAGVPVEAVDGAGATVASGWTGDDGRYSLSLGQSAAGRATRL